MLALDNKGADDILKLENKTIIKRSDGRWQGSYYVENKRKFVYDKTQKGCYLKLQERLLELKKIQPRKKREVYPTLTSWIQKWIEVYKVPTLKASTLYKTRHEMDNHVIPILGKKSLRQITQMDILELLSEIELSRTRQIVYVMLKDCLSRAVENDILDKNPMRSIKAPKHSKKELRALSQEEETLLLENTKDSPYEEIIKIQLYAGLRIGEALALKGTDIKDNYIIVDETVNDQKRIDSTKSNKVRNVPIFDGLEFLKNKNRQSVDLLYPGITRNQVYNNFVRLCNRIGITNVTLHCLRHTFATRCAQKLISAKQVQLWLGHSDISVTLKYYTNIDATFEAENISRKNK